MYKKVLVILHDSILPHMSKPTLMIDFLTAAYEVGKMQPCSVTTFKIWYITFPH